MFKLFSRKRVRHPDVGFYRYHYGEVFTNGAAEQAFESAFANPVVYSRGAGRYPSDTISATQPPPLVVVQRAPVAGIATIAGQLEFTSLTDNPLGIGN